MTLARARVLAAAGVALAAMGGCGAEPKQAPASPATGGDALKAEVKEAEPTTVEEAQARLERAKALLGGIVPGLSSATSTAGGTSVTAPTLPPSGTRETETQNGAGKAGADEGGRRASCVTPCSAIASMRRAVDAICRLAGADDARCTDARKTLGDSEAKVSPCGC
jgi:hypothetical protein